MEEGTVDREAIIDILRDLSREIRDLDVGNTVPRTNMLSTTAFLREFVAPNKPVVFTTCIPQTWPALSCWSEAYLREVAGAQHITVALTPNGRADCPTALPDGRPCFALPHQQKMPLAQFLDLLRASNNGELGSMVPYYQYQNSSLTEELPGLMDDIDRDLPFATEAFGKPHFHCPCSKASDFGLCSRMAPISHVPRVY